MADIVEHDPREATKVAMIIAGVALALNGLFFYLSSAYFADRVAVYGPVSGDDINGVRISFASLTVALAAAGAAAVRWPRLIGHAIAFLIGFASIAAAVAAYRKGLHVVLPATLLLIGMLLPALTRKSLKRSRAGWAFLCGMCAMLAVVTLFGATKVRGVLEISLWHAMVIPGLLAIGTAALAMVRTEYRD
ncbi:MAG: hypothetical protein JWP01_2691 [Myxococcales bacterium]|nr:hypothetical protein [Myxococcales bacterium]